MWRDKRSIKKGKGVFERMKRQGLIASIDELEKLVKELRKESYDIAPIWEEVNFKGKKTKFIDTTHKWQINIINKKGLSDTWEIE